MAGVSVPRSKVTEKNPQPQIAQRGTTGKCRVASRGHNITLASPIVPNEAVRHFPVASAHDLPVRAALPGARKKEAVSHDTAS